MKSPNFEIPSTVSDIAPELGDEIPCTLDAVLPALVDLVAYARESRPADAVGAIEVMDSQGCITRLVVELLDLVTGDAPDRIFPIILVLERHIIERLLELIYTCNILDTLER